LWNFIKSGSSKLNFVYQQHLVSALLLNVWLGCPLKVTKTFSMPKFLLRGSSKVVKEISFAEPQDDKRLAWKRSLLFVAFVFVD